MMESTALSGGGDPHVVLQLRHVLFGSCFLRKRPRQHELGFEHSAAGINQAIEGRGHPLVDGMLHPALDVLDRLAGVPLVPTPVEVLGHGSELDDEVVGKVFRLDFASFFVPKPNQRRLIVAHNNPGVRAADEAAAVT